MAVLSPSTLNPIDGLAYGHVLCQQCLAWMLSSSLCATNFQLHAINLATEAEFEKVENTRATKKNEYEILSP